MDPSRKANQPDDFLSTSHIIRFSFTKAGKRKPAEEPTLGDVASPKKMKYGDGVPVDTPRPNEASHSWSTASSISSRGNHLSKSGIQNLPSNNGDVTSSIGEHTSSTANQALALTADRNVPSALTADRPSTPRKHASNKMRASHVDSMPEGPIDNDKYRELKDKCEQLAAHNTGLSNAIRDLDHAIEKQVKDQQTDARLLKELRSKVAKLETDLDTSREQVRRLTKCYKKATEDLRLFAVRWSGAFDRIQLETGADDGPVQN